MSIIVKNGGLEKQLTSLKNMQHLGLQKSCFGLRSSSNPVSITFLLLVLEGTFLGFECSLKCIFSLLPRIVGSCIFVRVALVGLKLFPMLDHFEMRLELVRSK